MLAVLCVTKPRKGLFGLRRRAAVRAEIIDSGSGEFLKITAEQGRKGLDWDRVRMAAGRESGRLLLPQGLLPPPGCGIKPFRGVELQRKLMSHAAAALLKNVAVSPRLVRISVYDPQAAMPDLPLLLVPFAADIRVCTNRPERYAPQKHAAMREYGAVLTVTTRAGQLNESLLVLAPDANPSDCAWLKHLATTGGFVMTAAAAEEIRHFEFTEVIHGYIPHASESLLSDVPAGCGPIQFLSGLYELSGARQLGANPPKYLIIGGQTVPLKSAALKLAGIDMGIPI